MVARSSSPRHSSTTQRSSSITKVWLGFVLLLVIWQPLKLGFYMDDWPVVAGAAHQGSAFSGKRFHYIVGVDPSRPGLVLPRFVLSSLLGDNAFSWQSAMLLANIAVAVCIASAARAITGIGSRWAALAFGSAWLLLPWSTSNQFWTVLLPVELLVALYALLLASAIRKQRCIFDPGLDLLLDLHGLRGLLRTICCGGACGIGTARFEAFGDAHSSILRHFTRCSAGSGASLVF